MSSIIGCPICGSEKLYGKTCESCLDLNDEQWALKDAKDAYVADYISVAQLEEQIEKALSNPPKRAHSHIVYG